MKNTSLIYIDENRIATNYYALTEGQKAKRSLLGKKDKYDILDAKRLERICNGSDTVNIMGLDSQLSHNKYLFNHLIDIGIPMSKIIAYNGVIDTPNKVYNRHTDYDTYFNNTTMNEEVIHSSRLISMALESVHNLYYKTGRCNTCIDIKTRDMGLLFNNIEGFRINTRSDYRYTGKEDHSFSHTVKGSYNEYWQLEDDKYYMVSIKGLGYKLRLLTGIRLRDILNMGDRNKHICELNNDRELFKKTWCVYNNINERLRSGKNTYGNVNKVLHNLIGRVYQLSKGLHLFYCDDVEITFAVERHVDVVNILKVINSSINDLNIKNCFDYVDITEPSRDIEIHEEDENSRVSINTLKYIERIDEKINGNSNIKVAKLLNDISSKEGRKSTLGIFGK